ncbi:hypothetical protein F1880_007186 [Penicillium rolfsii]|nr:hypothetical protein F1880_007186 [Penicillium rolfsii]
MESVETLRADFQRQSKLFLLSLEEERGENINPQQQMKQQQEVQQLEALPRADIAAITHEIQTTANASHKLVMQLSIMRSLVFDGMGLRRSQVAEAHTHTYSWAYMSNFSEWMISDDPLFWISGKPGSGKSTLMKYLLDSPETWKNLQKWAGTRKLFIIDYFFWINGNDFHRSQEGLLQSLLFDIFRKCPELIETTFPERWIDSMNTIMGPWNRKELLKGLRKITRQMASSTAFCIFIDGLDEYQGEHEDLINVLSNIAHASPIKMCVASRPWNVFERALGTNQTRKLYLENLNRPDIELYVKNNLQDRADFQALALSNPDAAELASDIVERSKGVFLWVYLVVLLVKQGLVNEDRLVDLKRRVSAYPADLNDFFKHIMDSLDPIYQAQIARGFSVALAATNPLSVVSFWYLDELELDADMAITKQVDNVAVKSQRLERFWREEVRKMGARINGRFKGFLEIVKAQDWKTPSEIRVYFLHRTVRDFLATEDCQRVLQEWTPSHFDVHFALCNIQLAEVKELHPKLEDPQTLARLTDGIFCSARQFEKYHQVSLNTVLDHLERAIAGYNPSLYPWGTPDDKNFIMHAVMSNLTHFISHRFETEIISEQERIKCLERMFHTLAGIFDDDLRDPPSQLEVVRNPLDMILLLVETRPLTGNIELLEVLSALELYDVGTIRGILRCLCKSGLVDLQEFRELTTQVRRLTSLWDAKELEEMTRLASESRTGSGLPQPRIGRFGKTKGTQEKGRLHRWLGKLKSS